MDQDSVMEMVKRGATLLLLDVPQHTLVGIDTKIFTVGPIFMGIKMIPPGSHFVYYSSSNREGNEFSPMTGFFMTLSPSEVVVRKWNQQEERLIKLSEEGEARYSAAVNHLEFDHQLGPYPLQQFGKWLNLSKYITKDIIERLEPIGGEITIAHEPQLMDAISKEILVRDADHLLRRNKPPRSSEQSNNQSCYYTPIPHVIKHKGTPQEELTALNLDKTELLETILRNNYGGCEDLLLGELQFAFVAFLMGHSLEAFYQWKALVSLLFSCIEAPLHSRSQLFIKFTRLMYYQLKHGCGDSKTATDKGFSLFLDDTSPSKDIFLYRLCKEFISLIQEATVIDGDLLSWARKLKGLLEKSFGWDLDDAVSDMIDYEDDEYAPVVVPLADMTFHGDNAS